MTPTDIAGLSYEVARQLEPHLTLMVRRAVREAFADCIRNFGREAEHIANFYLDEAKEKSQGKG